MKKIKFRLIITFLFYLLFFSLLLKNSFSYLDPDFGWHLKAGEEVHLTKNVPHINHYNYVFEEADNYWVNHEWLSDYLVFLVYENFSYTALNILFALIIIATLVIANRFLIKNISPNKNFIYLIFVLELIGLKAMMPHLGIRIQEISILFLLLTLLIIYFFEKKSLKNQAGAWKILIWLIPLIYFWANLHGGWLLGIFILFFYLGLKLVEKTMLHYKGCLYKFFNYFLDFKTALKNKDLKIFFVFSLLASATTILTPYGFKLFDFLSSYKNTAYLKLISEWLPQHYFPYMYWQLFYIGLVLSIILIIIISQRRESKKILTPWEFFLSLLFIFLAIKSKRHFPLLFISTLPIIAKVLYNDFYLNTKKIGQSLGSGIIFIKIVTIFCLLSVSATALLETNFNKDPFKSFCHLYPCESTIFLKENPQYLEYNIFNEYSWGGFLIHQYSERKIFIDGRLPQKNINNHSYIEEYMNFFKAEEDDLIEKIEKYDIKLFLLAKDSQVKLSWLDKKIFNLKESDFKYENKIINFLEEKNSWEKIYEDEISIIYKKQ